jgi:hypothetical protein
MASMDKLSMGNMMQLLVAQQLPLQLTSKAKFVITNIPRNDGVHLLDAHTSKVQATALVMQVGQLETQVLLTETTGWQVASTPHHCQAARPGLC